MTSWVSQRSFGKPSMSKKRTLLMDGDTLAFRAASAVQHTIEHPSGYIEPFARRPEGEAVLDNMISRLKGQLGGTDILMFLSCPSEENWRYQVADTYKSNRVGSFRPYLLEPLKQYLRLKYDAFHLAFLEADDALGIYCTAPDLVEGDKIVVGCDKDFKTIPGKHYQLGDNEEGKPVIRTYNALEAAEAHYVQALSGDAVDGYAGCPGVGKTRAEKIVANPVKLYKKSGTITRGKNKGMATVKWHEGDPCSIWEAVVANYEKAGLTEGHALTTARLAKILLHGDYDMETHEVRLWVPGDE